MSDECSIIKNITIGASGGAIAGFTVYLFKFAHDKINDCTDKVIFSNENNNKHLSTRLIASYSNLTMDRVRYICSQHK